MKMRNETKTAMLDLKAELVGRCKSCKGRGWLLSEDPGTSNPCRCMLILRYLTTLIDAKIPRDYWWIGIDDLEVNEDYLTVCRFYNEHMDKAMKRAFGILFFGANGIGKTSMQCAIGKEAVVHGYNVQYFTAQQYIEARKSTDDTLAKEYESGKVILLDEMDKVYIKAQTNYVTKTLEDFLRRKTADGASFIICTNHDQETLMNVFGQSTASLLQRHLKFVDVEGEDYSEKLQARWDSLMETDESYYAEQITSMAQRLMDREIAEEEEDDHEWQKICNRKAQ